jgi:hypothetical protein
MTGEEILTGVMEADRVLLYTIRQMLPELPTVYEKHLRRIFRRYSVNYDEAKDHHRPIDSRLENVMQRGNEVCDVIVEMVKNHHLSDEQLERLKDPITERGKWAVAYSQRRKDNVVIFDATGKDRVN